MRTPLATAISLPFALTTFIAATDALAAQESEVRMPRPCDVAPGPGRAAVFGMASDSTTALPLQRLEVEATWEEDGRRRSVKGETDAGGAYRLCNVPAETRVTVEASRGTRATLTVELESGEQRRADLRTAAASATVSGRVVEHGTGRGIPDAEVRVGGTDVRAITGADGGFQLPALPGGTFAVSIAHIAYEQRRDSVTVQPSSTMMLTIQLAQQVIPLGPIAVEVRSQRLERAGFYNRRERGFGSYATRHDWERRMPRFPSDIARTMPGLRVVPRSFGTGYAILDRSNCAFRYVLDGTRVGSTFQMDDIPVEWIEAVEVYRGASTVPPEFAFPTAQARANCGVIVIWTRAAR